MTVEKPAFAQFANFSDSEAVLPIKGGNAVLRNEDKIYQGSYTTTVEIDGGEKVIKINRLLRYSPHKENPVEFGAYEDVDFLAKKSSDTTNNEAELAELNRKQAVAKMLAFAEYKRTIYEQIREYMPDHIPELHGFAVVDSPRLEIERLLKKAKLTSLTPEQEAQIPVHETALMEVWENATPEASIDTYNYKKLAELYRNDDFRTELKEFANDALTLIRKTGIMLDICDAGGVRAVESTGRYLNLKSPEDIVRLLESTDSSFIAYPRNTVFSDGQIKFYDLYPINTISEFTQDDEFVKAVVEVLKTGNHYALINLAGDQETRNGFNRRQIIQYLGLLKYMGAEF